MNLQKVVQLQFNALALLNLVVDAKEGLPVQAEDVINIREKLCFSWG
jgi:hypothetical protein